MTKQKKRLLFAIDEFNDQAEGGSVVVVRNLINALKDKYFVAVITTHRNGRNYIKKQNNGYIEYSIKVNYPIRFRAFISLYNPLIVQRLKLVLDDFKPDIVHAHTIHTYITYYFLRLANNRQIKTVFTCHDTMPIFQNRANNSIDKDKDGIPDTINYHFSFFKELQLNKLSFNPFRNIIIHFLMKNAVIVCVSSLVKTVLQVNGIKKCYVINNAVINQKTRYFSKKMNDDKNKHILFAGRLRKDKGAFQAINIIKVLPKNYYLHIAGNTKNDWEEMRKYAANLSIENKLIYHGFLKNNELCKLINQCDCVVIPSVYLDPLPTIALESLALNKPVIASSFSGLSDIKENHFYLKLINPYDVIKFRKAVIETIEQQKNYNSYYFEAKSNYEKFINNYVMLYENTNSNSRIH